MPGELGAEQITAVRPEDALGEEAVHHLQQDFFANPQARRVSPVPPGPLSVMAPVGFTGVVRQVAASLAEHAAVAQLADHI